MIRNLSQSNGSFQLTDFLQKSTLMALRNTLQAFIKKSRLNISTSSRSLSCLQQTKECPLHLPCKSCPLCSLYSKHLAISSSSFPLSSRTCPKSCTLSRKIEAKYLQDVSTCIPKFSYNTERNNNKVRRIKLRSIQTQMFQFRGLHSTRIPFGKSKPDSGKDCKSIREICKTEEEHCNIRTCCKDKDAKCYPEKVKCGPVAKCVKKKTKEETQCPTGCVRSGKCIITHIKKPAKMVYGSVECPPPKLIKPKTCPTMVEPKQHDDETVCNEKPVVNKPKKEICLPPPLPGPPTEPVSLCPCPPPPKMHPGPCPCPPIQKEEIDIKPSPPCLVKDKYPCRLRTYYCPPKKPCVKRKPSCDKKEDQKS